MKKTILGLVFALVLALGLVTNVYAGTPTGATIKDGTITYTSTYYLGDQPLMLGVDPYGYNYQAHMFAGSYFNAYANEGHLPPYSGNYDEYILDNPAAPQHWAWDYRDVQLDMKWNDAWLSNRDQDNNGKLDRHHGFASYQGSGAWITNHMSGVDYSTGEEVRWNYFVKIVAAPADAHKDNGYWYAADDSPLGPDIWGEFIVLQEIYNDPSAGAHGLSFKAMTSPGFGKY